MRWPETGFMHTLKQALFLAPQDKASGVNLHNPMPADVTPEVLNGDNGLAPGITRGGEKGLAETLAGTSQLLGKAKRAITGESDQTPADLITGQHHPTGIFGEAAPSDDEFAAHGTEEHVGKVMENVMEFMAGDEALKALTIPQKLQKIAAVAKFMEQHPFIAKMISKTASNKMIGSTVGNATISAAQTAAHGGDTSDVLKSAAIGGATGGTLEGATGALEKTLANRAAAKGVQTAADEFNIPLSAGQSTTGSVTQAVESALKKVPFVNTPFNKLAGAQNDAIQKAASDIADSIASKAASGTEAGEGIQNAISEAKNAAGKSYADAQQQISQAGAAQLPVPLSGQIADTAKKLLGDIELPDELSAGVKDVQGRQGAVDVLKNLAQDAGEDGTPRSMTWEQARRLKSQLFDLANSGESNVGKGALKQMTGAIDDSMQKALADSGSQGLADQFRAASNNYRAVNDAMDTSIIKRLMNKDPIEVGKYLLDNATPNSVNTLKQLAGSQMPQVQRGIFEEMFNRALSNPDGVVAGKVLQKEFQKLGPETAQAVFNPAQYNQIQRFVDLVGKVGLTPKTSLAKAASTVAGAGELGGVGLSILHGGLLLGSLKTGGTLLTARGLSKLMTSPGGINFMTKAITATQKGVNNPTARQALIGLMNYVTTQHANDSQD
jgi:hypothetical protein